MSCSCRAVIHPTWGPPSIEAFTAVEIPPADFLSPPQIIFPVAGSHANCITMNLRTTQFRKRGRSLSCLLTLYISYYYLLLYRSILSFELPMGLISSQQRIVYVYYLVHLGSSMWFMLGGQQTIDDPLSIFLNWSYNLPAIISSGSIHSFATITLDFCMHPLGLTKSNYFFIIHVRYCTQSYWTCREKDKIVAWEYNVMHTPLHSGWSAPPYCISRL